MNVKIAFHNLGCKVNSYETEVMIERFRKAGYELVDFDKPADAYIINTCSVTNIADRKSRQMLHRARAKNPDALIVAAGCYAQEKGVEILDDKAVDFVIGNNFKNKVFELVDNYFVTGRLPASPLYYERSVSHKSYENMRLERQNDRIRAFIKIQDGCNQFCSYCLIPYLRGPIRSRSIDDTYEEIKLLSEQGIREFVLTGIHLSSYGTIFVNDLWGPALTQLISRIASLKGVMRIRLGSLEPRIITEEFISELSREPKLCPHFHLSLQSGCDSVLTRMNRHYTSFEYREKVDLIRTAFEHPAITTDVITGFPGETLDEFEETYSFLKEIKLYETHVFPYSRRAGTKAAELPDQLTAAVKSERCKKLIELCMHNKREYEQYYLGRTTGVLLEEEKDGRMIGYNPEYVKFALPANSGNPGEIVAFAPDCNSFLSNSVDI